MVDAITSIFTEKQLMVQLMMSMITVMLYTYDILSCDKRSSCWSTVLTRSLITLPLPYQNIYRFKYSRCQGRNAGPECAAPEPSMDLCMTAIRSYSPLFFSAFRAACFKFFSSINLVFVNFLCNFLWIFWIFLLIWLFSLFHF